MNAYEGREFNVSNTLDNLKLLKTLVPQLPIFLAFINLAQDIVEKRDVTPAQAAEVDKILYSWLQFTPGQLKESSTPEEIEHWILSLETFINASVDLWLTSQKLFVV